MLIYQHTAMATQFEIRCVHPDEHYARQAARAAFEVVDRLEQQLSRFVENSDISRINHLAVGESTIVGYETMQCLQLAALMHEETGGAFDISLGTGFRRLECVPGEFLVSALSEGARLDLGAIGKGYAVDRAGEVLEDWEVSHALVDAGRSSVLALESPPGEAGWLLSLSEPGEGGLALARHCAVRCALGASGVRKCDHIVNPGDGLPVRTRPAAWVSAPRAVLANIGLQTGVEASAAAVADALSTAFMISPVEDIDAYCRNHPGLEAWILGGPMEPVSQPARAAGSRLRERDVNARLRHFPAASGAVSG